MKQRLSTETAEQGILFMNHDGYEQLSILLLYFKEFKSLEIKGSTLPIVDTDNTFELITVDSNARVKLREVRGARRTRKHGSKGKLT